MTYLFTCRLKTVQEDGSRVGVSLKINMMAYIVQNSDIFRHKSYSEMVKVD